MILKNAWNKEYENVVHEVKVKDKESDKTAVIQRVVTRERIKNGLKQDYDVYRKWEKAINAIKVEKPIVDMSNGVMWGTRKDR